MTDIQAYIEEENKRLEKDSSRCFDQREINVRMEYKYCPNMIVIDTPGMIHPPKGKQLTPQQRGLAMAAREAEDLIMNKISCQDYIILCVEDTTDWKHATARTPREHHLQQRAVNEEPGRMRKSIDEHRQACHRPR